jgi:hypothetical protein
MLPLRLLRSRRLQRVRRLLVSTGLAACALAGSDLAAQQVQVDSPLDAITEGRLSLELRPRYTDITQTNKTERTSAWTMRSIIGWQTAVFDQWRVVVEGIHTDVVGASSLNTDPATDENSPYPLLPDPSRTDSNRLYVEYLGLPDTRVRLGKQLVKLDNERFFSDVDFRQIPMLFTGLTVVNESLPDGEIYAALLNRVRTVVGTQAKTRIWLLRAAYSPLRDQSVAAYAYGLNQPQTDLYSDSQWYLSDYDGVSDNSHQVFGLRAEGVVPIGAAVNGLYTAEGAHQRHYAGGDPVIEAHYWRLGGGAVLPKLADVGARLDREVKSSNGGRYGFQMPFEDTYAFNGWALQFTRTPAKGLRDTWASLRARPGRLQLVAELHRFDAAFGGLNYGNERDFRASYALTPSLSLKLQHARFRAGDPAADYYDLTKTWLSLTYDY